MDYYLAHKEDLDLIARAVAMMPEGFLKWKISFALREIRSRPVEIHEENIYQ